MKDFLNKIKIILALALLLLLTVAGWEIRALRAEKTLAEQKAALALIEGEGLRQEVAAGLVALNRREEKAAELAAQTEALRHELSELYLNNEPCAAWADALVPEPVLKRLR